MHRRVLREKLCLDKGELSMPYCLYLRKSRADVEAERAGEGETLSRHEHALLELARRQHLDVTEI